MYIASIENRSLVFKIISVQCCIFSYTGPNKAAFLISNYNAPQDGSDANVLISNALKRRLYNQQPLRQYLDEGQVVSWNDKPNELQTNRLVELANQGCNPVTNNSCIVL